MKILRFSILVMIVLFSGCTKDGDDDPVKSRIIGKWDWKESNGGFTGMDHYTPENTGDERQIIFKKDNTFYEILNSDTIHKTDYFIKREGSILQTGIFDILTVNYEFYIPELDSTIVLPMRYRITEVTDSLKIYEDVFDGFGHRYLKLSNR